MLDLVNLGHHDEQQPPLQPQLWPFLASTASAAKEATLMLTLAAHILAWLSEMLTFFLCIFFLKKWLQFDLFRGLPGAPEAAIFNNNNNKAAGALKSERAKRFWKRKNRSRSPSRSVARSETEEILTSDEEEELNSELISTIEADDGSSSSNNSDFESDCSVETEDESWKSSSSSQHSNNKSAKTSKKNEVETEGEGEGEEEEVIPISSDEDLINEDSIASSLDSELSWLQEHYTSDDERYSAVVKSARATADFCKQKCLRNKQKLCYNSN
jgi:hypothetical protein